MSTEDVKNQSTAKEPVEHKASTNDLRQKIRTMRIASATLTAVALAIAATLLAAGGTAIIASNIGIESLTGFRLPGGWIVGSTAFLLVIVGGRTYTSMRHREFARRDADRIFQITHSSGFYHALNLKFLTLPLGAGDLPLLHHPGK